MNIRFEPGCILIMLLFIWYFIPSAGLAQDIKCAKGTVYEGVPVAADGCGVMINIDTVSYKAEGIPEEFVVDGMEVFIKYVEGETFYCGRGQAPIPTIHIQKIKKASARKKRCKSQHNK